MATTIRDLLVRLGVDADEKAIASFDSKLTAAKGTMIAVTGVAVAGAAAVGVFALSFAQGADDIGKAAARIGVTAEELQEYEIVAGKAGATNLELRDGLKEVTKRFAEARAGSKETGAAFTKLGIDITKTATTAELMNQLADGISKVADEGERIRLADRIAGEAGNKLLPLLKGGAAGLERMRQEARDTGGVISDELVAASEEFNDSLTDALLVAKRYRNQLAAKLIPALTEAVNRGRDWFLINRDIIDQRFDRAVGFITGAVKVLQRGFEKVNKFVEDDIGGWDVVFMQIGKVIGSLAAAAGIAQFIKFLGLAKAAVFAVGAAASYIGAPIAFAIGLGIAALLSFLFIAEDFVTFLQGGRSVIGQFLAAFGLEDEARTVLLEELNQMKVFVLALFDAFKVLIDIFGPTDEELAAINERLDEFKKTANDATKAVIVAFLDVRKSAAKDLNKLTQALDNPRVKIEAIIKVLDRLLKKAAAARKAFTDTKLGGLLSQTPGGRLASAGGQLSTGLLGGLVGRAQRGLAATRPAAAAASSTSTTTVTQGGDNVTINTGADAQEVAAVLERRDEQRRLATLDAARGGMR